MISRLLFFSVILTLFSCSQNEQLFQDLPEQCSDCIVETEWHGGPTTGCDFVSFRKNLNPDEVIDKLKSLQWTETDNQDIGATNDAELMISKSGALLLNLGIWLHNDHMIIYHSSLQKYFQVNCDEMLFLFELGE